MSDPANAEDSQRAPSGDAAWREAKRRVADRNDQTRKAGKDRRAAAERRAALRRVDRERRGVFH